MAHVSLPHFPKPRVLSERSDEKLKIERGSGQRFISREAKFCAYARSENLSRVASEQVACVTASIASRQTVSAGKPVSFMCNSACAIRSSCARNPASFHSTSWRLKLSSRSEEHTS